MYFISGLNDEVRYVTASFRMARIYFNRLLEVEYEATIYYNGKIMVHTIFSEEEKEVLK